MRTYCGYCGDPYTDTGVHNCYVLFKQRTQEKLSAPRVTDWAGSGGVEGDAEWRARHGKALAF